MKIKVDKREYEELLNRVDILEKQLRDERNTLFKSWYMSREKLFQLMEDYFKAKCITVVMERDKNKIVAEVRKQAMDNLFKEDK